MRAAFETVVECACFLTAQVEEFDNDTDIPAFCGKFPHTHHFSGPGDPALRVLGNPQNSAQSFKIFCLFMKAFHRIIIGNRTSGILSGELISLEFIQPASTKLHDSSEEIRSFAG